MELPRVGGHVVELTELDRPGQEVPGRGLRHIHELGVHEAVGSVDDPDAAVGVGSIVDWVARAPVDGAVNDAVLGVDRLVAREVLSPGGGIPGTASDGKQQSERGNQWPLKKVGGHAAWFVCVGWVGASREARTKLHFQQPKNQSPGQEYRQGRGSAGSAAIMAGANERPSIEA